MSENQHGMQNVDEMKDLTTHTLKAKICIIAYQENFKTCRKIITMFDKQSVFPLPSSLTLLLILLSSVLILLTQG